MCHHTDVYQRILNTSGIDEQLGIAVEEMGELIVAISQWKRGRIPASAVIEEIADVQIMMEQLRIYFGEDEVEKVKQKKLERLKRFLDSGVWVRD